jgi:uncharacterized membrane protein YedE/YeeE
MRAQRIKALVAGVGGVLALGCAGWAMYLEIASDGKDPAAMRWFGVGLGLAALTWVLERIVTRYAKPQS